MPPFADCWLGTDTVQESGTRISSPRRICESCYLLDRTWVSGKGTTVSDLQAAGGRLNRVVTVAMSGGVDSSVALRILTDMVCPRRLSKPHTVLTNAAH